MLVEVGSMEVAVDAVLFDLGGTGLVLGMAWLTKIGGMWVDWFQ